MAELQTGQTLETADPVLLVENLPAGTHVFELLVADESGNLSKPARVKVTVLRRGPRVTSFDPVFGWPGDAMVIWVTGLDADLKKNEIFFQGLPAPVTGGSTRTLHAAVPALARTGPISVVNAAGQGVSDSPFFIPRRARLACAGARDLAFSESSSIFLALSGRDGSDRCALWSLPAPGADRNPKAVPPQAEIPLPLPSSRIAIFNDESGEYALVWSPGQEAISVLRWNAREGFSGSVLKLPGALQDLGNAQSPVALARDGQGSQWLLTFTPKGIQSRWAVPEPLNSLHADPERQSVCALAASGNIHRFAIPDLAARGVWKAPADAPPVHLAACSEAGGIWAFSQKPPRAYFIRKDGTRQLDLGFAPEAVAAHPSGRQAFFAGSDQSRLLAVSLPDNFSDPGLNARALNVPFGVADDRSLSTGGNGKDLVALHGKSKALSFFNAETYRLGLTLPFGDEPRFALTRRDGTLFAVAGSSFIEVIETASVRT